MTRQEEIQKLSAAVDAFATEMKARLHQKAVEGQRGWDNPASLDMLRDDLYCAATTNPLGRTVDIANYAMFLWNLKGK